MCKVLADREGVMRLHREHRGNEILKLYGDFIFFRSQCEFWFRWPVVTHLFSVVQHPQLMDALRKRIALRVMQRIPVHLITARAALIGAASYRLKSPTNHNG
jgi:hypothetical protein